MLILPSAYLPPIGYFVEIVAADSPAVIDLGEHYIKRTIRNRAEIMTAQGAISLTIPVRSANRPCSPMSGMVIDNSKRWQHQHWITIMSAYRSSPFFEHYAPYIEPLYKREWHSLVEFNAALCAVIFKLLGIGAESQPTTSLTYIEPSCNDRDLRPKGVVESLSGVEEYIQVFSDRLPFAPNLSILDLLFCEGNATLSLLAATPR